MTKLLIVYGTTEGQTARIAGFMAEVAERRGFLVDVVDACTVPARFSLDSYDGVLVGASMHVGGFQRCVRTFVKRHRAKLAHLPAAFFSVSLTAVSPKAADRARLEGHLTRFFDKTGWHPRQVASFAGALAYTHYGFLKRKVMQSIARKVGAPTDPTWDYTYTDWKQVARFAEAFVAALVAQPAPVTAV